MNTYSFFKRMVLYLQVPGNGLFIAINHELKCDQCCELKEIQRIMPKWLNVRGIATIVKWLCRGYVVNVVDLCCKVM